MPHPRHESLAWSPPLHLGTDMRAHRLAMFCLCLSLAGCAAALPGYMPPSKQRDRMVAARQTGGGFDEGGTYSLTDQEQKLDCKGLTGSMTVKILQMREAGTRTQSTVAARTAQKVARPIAGGTTYGVDLTEDLARDDARLKALNAQLVAKGCKSFDLDKELAAGNTATPSPTIEAKKPG